MTSILHQITTIRKFRHETVIIKKLYPESGDVAANRMRILITPVSVSVVSRAHYHTHIPPLAPFALPSLYLYLSILNSINIIVERSSRLSCNLRVYVQISPILSFGFLSMTCDVATPLPAAAVSVAFGFYEIGIPGTTQWLAAWRKKRNGNALVYRKRIKYKDTCARGWRISAVYTIVTDVTACTWHSVESLSVG